MTAPAKPTVSVIVPAWNAERTLAETLESVAAQTFADLEIIIVDDGSTDSTAEIARQFCSREPRARLLRQANGGVAAARNHGVEHSSGAWIAPVDADDLWHPTKIEKQIAAALSSPVPPGFVYCWFCYIDEQSLVIGTGAEVSLNGPAFNRLVYFNAVENGSALLIRRDALLKVGGYDPSLRDRGAQGCEDVLVQLQIAGSEPIACVPEFLVGHRRHSSNMSSGFDRMGRSWELALEKVMTGRPPLPPKLLRWMDGKYAFDVAEQRAAERRIVPALSALTTAMRLDPRRTLALLSYRVARAAARRARRAPDRRPLHYREFDPRRRLSPDPFELTAGKRRLDALTYRRLRRLGGKDQEFGRA